MNIYSCQIELHDSLYFATREIGRLYETEPVLHNYALCYALGLVDNPEYQTQVAPENEYRYFCTTQMPQYQEHLTRLNEVGIYITPARAVWYTTSLNTWKYANNNYHVEMQKTQKNIPSFGRNKEIAPGSKFECLIISQNPLKLPRWIRLGKWMSKAAVTIDNLGKIKTSTGQFIFPYPLNPLDVMFSHRVLAYDVINMPPVSLTQNVQIQGEYDICEKNQELKIPARMSYCFG